MNMAALEVIKMWGWAVLFAFLMTMLFGPSVILGTWLESRGVGDTAIEAYMLGAVVVTFATMVGISNAWENSRRSK